MITTLTPNPCFDRTLEVEKFDIYKMNRVRVLRSDLGGKGINVSAALQGLGVETCALAVSFQDDENAMSEVLAAKGFEYEFIPAPGRLRTCYKIFDKSISHTIEINEYGSGVEVSVGERLLEALQRRAPKSTAITLSGSLPEGLGSDFYLRCVKAVRKASSACRIVVDAEKSMLLKALEGGVDILKPNIHEFQETFQCNAESVEALDIEARKIAKQFGLEILCVSLGSQGAYITNGAEAWRCHPPKVAVRSIQGAGDSVIAGMCMALEKGLSLPEILRYGVCAAGDSISREGTQLCSLDGMRKLLEQDIALEKI